GAVVPHGLQVGSAGSHVSRGFPGPPSPPPPSPPPPLPGGLGLGSLGGGAGFVGVGLVGVGVGFGFGFGLSGVGVGSGGGVYGAWPSSGASPSTKTGGGKSSDSVPSSTACITA